MAERGIIMSTWSVQRMLAGEKTQTRRVIKPQPEQRTGVWGGPYLWSTSGKEQSCRYQVGDRLWVKETWRNFCEVIEYRADNLGVGDPGYIGGPWRPSIFMPRWAARPELDRIITDIRVERVQEISEEDANAEGAECIASYPSCDHPQYGTVTPSYCKGFELVWNFLHRKPKPVKLGPNSRWVQWLGWTSIGTMGYISFPWSEDSRDPRKTIREKQHMCFPNPFVWCLSFEKGQ